MLRRGKVTLFSVARLCGVSGSLRRASKPPALLPCFASFVPETSPPFAMARGWSGLAPHSHVHDVYVDRKRLVSYSRRNMFIQTQTTPNADAVMFLPGRDVMPGGTGSADFPSVRTAAKSPLARKLFAIDGVRAVFLGAHFITVTKGEHVDWTVLRPEIFEIVMDFFLNGEEEVILLDREDAAALNSDTVISDDDSEVVAMIKELLETRVKPAVAEDGGSIVFRGFHPDDGIVDLELQGACSSCSSSSITLKSGVENMLRHYIPEVKTVREVPGVDALPLEKANQEAFNKVEENLAKTGILRS